MARVPVNGRNFEYLSGEDPWLGAALVGPVVEGIQAQGVIANAKHFIHNNQEFNRTTMVSAVGERAQWEVYAPPFQAAVNAGVGSFMCSYNNISTTAQQAAGQSFWACENPETLSTDLKGRMGFGTAQGWVMSDWGATHSTAAAANAGLDQEMGGAEHFTPELLQAAIDAGDVSQATIDEKVLRILTPMLDLGLFGDFAAWRQGSLADDVTSPQHVQLARDLAAASQVLLKNDGGLLPFLDATTTAKKQEIAEGKKSRRGSGTPVAAVAVVGDAAAFLGTFGGGGSGSVVPKHAVSVLEGLYDALGLDYSSNGGSNCTFHQDTDYYQESGDLATWAATVDECAAACAAAAGCSNFAFKEPSSSSSSSSSSLRGEEKTTNKKNKKGVMEDKSSSQKSLDGDGDGELNCWLKPNDAGATASPGTTAGDCPTPAATAAAVTFVPTSGGPAAAAAAAAAADVAIVVVATTSSEGGDRGGLSFGDEDLALAAAVTAKAGAKTLVVAVAPGAVLLPFLDDAAAVVLAMMPGEQVSE